MRVFVYVDVSCNPPDEWLNEAMFEIDWRKSCIEHDEWLMFGFGWDVFPFVGDDPPPMFSMSTLGGTNVDAVYKHWVENSNPEDGFLLVTDGYCPPMKILPGHGHAEFIVVGDGPREHFTNTKREGGPYR